MQPTIKIDAQGFNRMIAALEKKTGMSYRNVLRGVAAATLTNAAQKTKTSTPKKITQDVDKLFRKPLRLKNGDQVGVTRAGKVWFKQKGWDPKNWILIETSGKLRNVGKEIAYRGRILEITPKLRSRINLAVREARALRKHELAYRKKRIGAGKKSWLEIMKKLGLRLTSQRGLGKAQRAIIDPKLKQSVTGKEISMGRDRIEIEILSKAQAALNPRSGGIRAFGRALSGQIRGFKTAMTKDLAGYAQRFAQRNGFVIR
tara:strand:+ start:453 stop:1229 length:777 start_codon:yes stop_codon:yes gene_type:complete